jgi:hypothetical protein
MTRPARSAEEPRGTEIDANGVDRAQIRVFLRLDPEEGLRRVEAFIEAAFEIRERNETSQVR